MDESQDVNAITEHFKHHEPRKGLKQATPDVITKQRKRLRRPFDRVQSIVESATEVVCQRLANQFIVVDRALEISWEVGMEAKLPNHVGRRETCDQTCSRTRVASGIVCISVLRRATSAHSESGSSTPSKVASSLSMILAFSRGGR
jgi:hypothetical protein